MFTIFLILAFLFVFLNGLNDSANIVATVISSRALQPRAALLLTALGEFLGPFLFGVAVARSLSTDLFAKSAISIEMLVAALLGALLWRVITWYLGIPASSSHALMGGLIGAALVAGGAAAIQLPGLQKIVLALLISPLLGLAAGYLVTKVIFFAARSASPRINRTFQRLQLLSSFGLALGHGSNDAQKTMGVLILGLLATGQLETFSVPRWVLVASAVGMALGTALGGWRVIRTLGRRIMKVRPVHGFASQLGGLGVMWGAAFLGGPVSLTQVMSSSIMGSGAAQRLKGVRWQVGQEMLVAWLLTIPVSGLVAAGCYVLISLTANMK
jgi:PiT family inorganic phosphate transporter